MGMLSGDTRIGPGRLVLVVGPSGAGKDTLITHVRAACACDPAVVFPRRIVTRPASAFEDNISIAEDDFARLVHAGAFALWWEAHGHKYGIPVTIDTDLRGERVVVCNVSRAVIDVARARYERVVVALITAPADILAARLSSRERASDGDLAQRLRRMPQADYRPDVVIENVGTPDIAAGKLLRAIRGG
jgi:ribose 1,5-bisphosphokinase